MIGWVLWFFVAPVLFLLDGLLARVGWPAPSLTLALCLFLSLFARPAALPGLLVCAALGRSILLEGDAALHVLVLGIPVAVLVPLRAVFFRHHPLWQCVAAGFLALMVPKAGALVARFAAAEVHAAVGLADVLGAMLVVPPATWLLRRLPPLSRFGERAA